MINKKSITIIFSIISILLLAITIPNLNAVEVKKIEVRSFDDFQEGQFKGSALDSKGRLFIGPQIKEIPGPGKEFYLSLDTAFNGDIFIGTGHQASVYRIKPVALNTKNTEKSDPEEPIDLTNRGNLPENVEEVFVSDEDLDVYALLVTGSKLSKEIIYAGTSPDGKIYKITADKGKKVFFNTNEKFIWDLKEDKSGNIICAVGNSGGVYQISPEGQAVKIFASEDTHIISLAITRGNSILAGSGDRGILYRIENRKVKVLFDSPFDEIRGICEDKDGNIFFSASKEISFSGQTRFKKNTPSLPYKTKKDKDEPKTLEKSVLYCLHTNGIVEKIWSSETEYIYSACYAEKSGSVLIATGDSGRVYSIKKDGSFAIIYESDSAQIFKIVEKQEPGKNGGNGFILITNNTPAVTEIEDAINNKGIYYSDIYDLQIQSKLGRLYWEGETSSQTEISVFIRSGNSNIPDSTWTQWSAPFTDSENSNLNISDCRYFQVKVVMNTKIGTETPSLDQFKIFYIQSNLGPQIKKINIRKATLKPSVTVIDSNGKSKSKTSDNKDENYLNVSWEARDLNKDKLKYNIYLKKFNSKNWILFKEDITENKLKLDTQLFQDGKYLLRVEADDSLSNPPGAAESAKMESSPFLIDSTAPVISAFTINANHIQFTVEDKTSIISHVRYSFDGKLWYPVFPVDLLNDSKKETFDFTLNNLKSKKYIFIKVMDEFKNCKVFQKEF